MAPLCSNKPNREDYVLLQFYYGRVGRCPRHPRQRLFFSSSHTPPLLVASSRILRPDFSTSCVRPCRQVPAVPRVSASLSSPAMHTVQAPTVASPWCARNRPDPCRPVYLPQSACTDVRLTRNPSDPCRPVYRPQYARLSRNPPDPCRPVWRPQSGCTDARLSRNPPDPCRPVYRPQSGCTDARLSRNPPDPCRPVWRPQSGCTDVRLSRNPPDPCRPVWRPQSGCTDVRLSTNTTFMNLSATNE